MFAFARKSLLEHKSDPIESAKLMVAVLCLLIRSLPPELTCDVIQKVPSLKDLEFKLNTYLSLSNNDNTKTQEQRLEAAVIDLLNCHASNVVIDAGLDLDTDLLTMNISMISQVFQRNMN